MENKENRALEAKVLDINDLNKISGAGIVQVDYSYHPYGLRNKEEVRSSTGYYLPKNEKFYKSFEVASETDKTLGGDGSIVSKTKYTDCIPKNFEDIGYEQWND